MDRDSAQQALQNFERDEAPHMSSLEAAGQRHQLQEQERRADAQWWQQAQGGGGSTVSAASGNPFAAFPAIVAVGAVLAVLATVVLTLLVPVAIWVDATEKTLRPALESLFGGAVAQTRAEHGSPVVVAVVLAIPALAAMIGLTVWRRRLVRRHVRGELPWVAVYAVSVARMVVILFGASLVGVAALIASGADLRNPNAENTLFGDWQILVAIAGLLALSFYGLRWSIRRARSGLPQPPGLATG